MSASKLFSPITLRGLTIKNRIGVSPMCQYSAVDGFATDWHLVHLGARAQGGAGLIIVEATAVTPEGRISPACLGLWSDDHIAPLARINEFAKAQGAVMGIQLAHAGRKGSCAVAWQGGKQLSLQEGGWQVVAPSAIPFLPENPVPHALTLAEIETLKGDFVEAAKRAVFAGFQLLEIHAAHGYLLHEFLSPLSNKREDAYGGNPDNRHRLLLEIVDAVRKAVPPYIVVGVRLSCIDWAEGGITIEDTVDLARKLKDRGLDFIDCSSGALVPDAKIKIEPLYQVPFARAVRDGANITTFAVGLITTAEQAESVVAQRDADMVLLARAMLKDAFWPLHAAEALGEKVDVPLQYVRGF